MPEREAQTSEQVNLYERGGLTEAHWKEVVKRITSLTPKRRDRILKYLRQPKHYEIPEKIIGYAQKVILGEFPDTGLNHRRYLGRRHWRFIASLGVIDKLKIFRISPPWPEIEIRKNQTAEEVHNFARGETMANFSLNDHIARLGSRIFLDGTRYGEPNRLVWYDKTNTWQLFGDIYQANYERTGAEWAGYGYLYEAKADIVLNNWVLTTEDVEDPVHVPPNELMEKLLNKARLKPGEVQSSLRDRSPSVKDRLPYNNQFFGLLEGDLN